ncbi:MAG: BlaI/MecI/CopY family transcriptional regulator [Caulobacteraceae bacterium]
MRISGAESRIMDALWRRGPLPVEDIAAEAAPERGWSQSTVKALIGRLMKKGALESVREGGRARYRPLVAREDYMAAETEGFLGRLFGGELAPFVSYFARSGKLTSADLARLKALVETLDDER